MLSLSEAVRSGVVNLLILPERLQSGVAYNPLSARMARDPLSRVRGPARQGASTPQSVAEGLGVHAPRRRGRDPARPPALRQRSAQGDAVVSTAGHAAAPGRILAAVPGSPGPHAASGACQQSLFTESGRGVRAPHPRDSGGPAGRHRRPGLLRSHESGGWASSRDRHRRDAGFSRRRPGPVQSLVGAARASSGADGKSARRRSRQSDLAGVRRLLPTDPSRSAGLRRATTSSAPSCGRRTEARS